jgi:serine/threonine protein kinase
VKLGDRGWVNWSRFIEDSIPETVIHANMNYWAPEISARKEFSPKADVWSLGCVFIELITLTPAVSLNIYLFRILFINNNLFTNKEPP